MNGYISIREASYNGAFRNDGSTNTVLSGVFRGQNDSGVPGQFLLMQKSQVILANPKVKSRKGA